MAQQNASGNPLAASSLATSMSASLPKDVSPQIKNPYEAIALAVHAGMVAVGFKLKGLGEEHRIEASSDAQEPQPLPTEWNATTNSYAFRYSHSQSAMEFILKIGRLGNKAIVDGIAVEAGKRTSFDITPEDFVSQSSLPATPLPPDATLEQAQQKIQEVFISPARLADLGALLKLNIIQKLAPGISKEGYVEEQQEETLSSSTQQAAPRNIDDPLRYEPPPARPYPYNDPLAAQPRRPYVPPGMEPPGFEDEYDIMRPPGRGGAAAPGGLGGPFGIGDRDLYPPGLGPNDPIRPHLGPGGLPRPGGGGGMHPTFDDPLFGGQGGSPGGRDDPQVPPGARYDPTGPGDPRTGRRFPGGFPGGGPPNPFAGFGGGDFI